MKTVTDHTTADRAAIVVCDGAGIDENDPAIVALRVWSRPIDLHAFPNSQLCGEVAFPMISRGQLVGALVCGAKRDGEAYAPDESEALQALAQGVATALDTLSIQDDGVTELLRDTQALILLELQRLPSAIASALREGGEKDR